MRARAIGPLAALALAGCAAQVPPPRSASAPARIDYELASWGAPQLRWWIGPDGIGAYTYADKTDSKSFFDYEQVTMFFDAGPQGYAQVAELLAPLRPLQEKPPGCANRVTDAPYGGVRWTGDAGEGLRFDLGCMSREWSAVYAKLREANDLVGAWGKAGKEISRQRTQPR